MNHLIEATNITKSYSNTTILDSINLTIKAGSSIAFVGANGCGKSTLLRILSGITKPTTGKVQITTPIKMAFIPDHFEKTNITISTFMNCSLELAHQLELQHTLDKYYSIFQLSHLIHIPMKYLSKGSLQKAAVIQALVQDVDLLFLDEPLSGQDALSKLIFIEKLLEKKAAGTTIVMACHEKEMIDEITDNIFLIEKGKIHNGEHYFYNQGNELSLFIVSDENNMDGTRLIQQLKERDYFKSLKQIGKKYRIMLDKSKSNEFLKLCLQNNLHLIKYEEVYK